MQGAICHNRAQSHSAAGPGPSSSGSLPVARTLNSPKPRARQHAPTCQASSGRPQVPVLRVSGSVSRLAAQAAIGVQAEAGDGAPTAAQTAAYGAPNGSVSANNAALAASLGQSIETIDRLLIRFPPPIDVSAAELSASAIGLSAELHIDPLRALGMLLKRPSLLCDAPEDVHAAVAALAREADMPVSETTSLVASQPSLLDIPYSETLMQTGALQRLAGALEVTVPALIMVLSRCSSPALQQLLSSPPSDIRQQVSDLREVVVGKLGAGRGGGMLGVTQVLVVRCPQLLLTPTKQVESALDLLNGLLQTSRKKMFTMLEDYPSILCAPPSEILENYKGLISALRMNQAAVNDMLLSEPRLVNLDPQKVKTRVDGLLFGLYIPREKVLDMLVRQPQLLLYYPQTLSAHMVSLMDLLEVQHEVAVAMLHQYPNLLMFSKDLLKAKLSLLTELFNLPPMHVRELLTLQPRIVSYSADRLTRSRDVIKTLLAVDDRNMAAMILTHPDLLVAAPGRITGKSRDLCALLSIEEDQAGQVLKDNPLFLRQPTKLWQSNLDTVMGLLGLSLEQVQSACLSDPKLLSTDPKQLLLRCQTLAKFIRTSSRPPRQNNGRTQSGRQSQQKRSTNTHPAGTASDSGVMLQDAHSWARSLETASGVQLSRLLGCEPFVLEHVEYLVVHKLQSRMPLLSDELYNMAAFRRRFPDFITWVKTRYNTNKNANNGNSDAPWVRDTASQMGVNTDAWQGVGTSPSEPAGVGEGVGKAGRGMGGGRSKRQKSRSPAPVSVSGGSPAPALGRGGSSPGPKPAAGRGASPGPVGGGRALLGADEEEDVLVQQLLERLEDTGASDQKA